MNRVDFAAPLAHNEWFDARGQLVAFADLIALLMTGTLRSEARCECDRVSSTGISCSAVRIIAAVFVWLISLAPTSAATPTLDVGQFAHATWPSGEGFAKGAIYDVAQTPDGYLWLGTQFGLLRFDGVTTTPWPPDRPIVNEIPTLMAAPDGTLWIGTSEAG